MIRVHTIGADPNILHLSRSRATVDQWDPGSTICANVLNESALFFGGLLRGLSASLRYQSVVARVQRPSSLPATFPAQRCFGAWMYSMGSLAKSSSLEILSSLCLNREIPMMRDSMALLRYSNPIQGPLRECPRLGGVRERWEDARVENLCL